MIHKPVILGIAYSPVTVYVLGELCEVTGQKTCNHTLEMMPM